MESRRFDDLARIFAAAPSRRGLLSGVLTAVVGLIAGRDRTGAAPCIGYGRPCSSSLQCCGGTCTGGRCACSSGQVVCTTSSGPACVAACPAGQVMGAGCRCVCRVTGRPPVDGGCPCATAGDCPGGVPCAAGTCCASGSACGSGESAVCCEESDLGCTQTGICCDPARICAGGTTCCGPDESCHGDACCPTTQICATLCCPADTRCCGLGVAPGLVAGLTLTPSCQECCTSSDCPSPQTCVLGTCITQCSRHDDCQTGEACHYGTCVPCPADRACSDDNGRDVCCEVGFSCDGEGPCTPTG